MRRTILATAATLAILAAGSLVPNRAEATASAGVAPPTTAGAPIITGAARTMAAVRTTGAVPIGVTGGNLSDARQSAI